MMQLLRHVIPLFSKDQLKKTEEMEAEYIFRNKKKTVSPIQKKRTNRMSNEDGVYFQDIGGINWYRT